MRRLLATSDRRLDALFALLYGPLPLGRPTTIY
jgi:hypothetical protein